MVSLGDLFDVAMECHEAIDYREDNPTEAYDIARGEFRVGVIDALREEIDAAAEAYIHAAEIVSDAWETMHNIDAFLTANRIDSGLPKDFLKSVNVPSPVKGANDYCDGMEAPNFRFDMSVLLSKEAMQLFRDDFDPECAAPEPVAEYDVPLYRDMPLGTGYRRENTHVGPHNDK